MTETGPELVAQKTVSEPEPTSDPEPEPYVEVISVKYR